VEHRRPAHLHPARAAGRAVTSTTRTRSTSSTTSSGSVSVSLEVRGLRDLLRDLNRLPRDMQDEVRDASLAISTDLAGRLKAAAAVSPTPQAALIPVAPKRDRLVKVVIGGSRKVGRPYRSRTDRLKSGRGRKVSAKAGALLWGSETGSRSGEDRDGRRYTSRFVAGHNASGWWVGPTVNRYAPEAVRRWLAAVDDALRPLKAG